MPRSSTSFSRGRSGNPHGRPRGAKDAVPRTFRGLCLEYLSKHADDVDAAIAKGVTGKQAHRYLAILASLEKQQHEVSGEDGGPVIVKFVDA